MCANISSDWSLTNGTKTGVYGNAHEIEIDYVLLSGVKTIYDIHYYFNYDSTINLGILLIIKKSRMYCKKSNC